MAPEHSGAVQLHPSAQCTETSERDIKLKIIISMPVDEVMEGTAHTQKASDEFRLWQLFPLPVVVVGELPHDTLRCDERMEPA